MIRSSFLKETVLVEKAVYSIHPFNLSTPSFLRGDYLREYETGREERILLSEPKSSAQVVFHPLPVSFLEKFARKFK